MNKAVDPKVLIDVEYEAFAQELFKLRREMEADYGEKDIKHFFKIVNINRAFTILGYLLSFIPNPISAYFIAQGIFGRWLVMHHVGHGGYDKVPGMPERYHSKRFALKGRRYLDWFDWILPEAWNYEHGHLHHYHTSEEHDPDLVEDHAEFLRNLKIPKIFKYAVVVFLSLTWKYLYYAPNTLRAMEEKGKNPVTPNVFKLIWDNGLSPFSPRVRRLWLKCYLPYILFFFVAMPAIMTGVFYLVGAHAMLGVPIAWVAASVLFNCLLAECIVNVHTFVVIAPNHAGDDLYRFSWHFRNVREFCVNQIISSVNYRTGTDLIDYSQGWLNYQIEHHVFPNMPMIRYREIQPRVEDLCKKYEIPYIQQNVFSRVRKLTDIMVGNSSMMWLEQDKRPEMPA